MTKSSIQKAELERRAWEAYEKGDFSKALPRFLELASEVKPYYLVVAARMYMDGEGTAVDTVKATELLNQASALGVRESLLQRAELAARGGNEHEYFRLIVQAERSGLMPAQYLLGLCYVHGRGTARDVGKGMTLMRNASSAGHVGAKAFVARELMRRPSNVLGFARGIVLFVVATVQTIVLSLTNPHDERLR